MDQTPPPPLRATQALFLDFDGTLVESGDEPVTVKTATRMALNAALARQGGAVAVLSGRPLADLVKLLDPITLPLAGSHGSEIRLANGRILTPSPTRVRETEEIAKTLRAALGEKPMIEAKAGAVTLHFRDMPQRAGEFGTAIRRAAASFQGWQVVDGNGLVEARLASATKGHAVERFMREPPFAGRVPVFIGDDDSDEDGVKAALNYRGFGERVGDGESGARHRLPDVNAVFDYIATAG